MTEFARMPDHQLALYASIQELTEVAGPFIDQAVADGRDVLVIAKPKTMAALMRGRPATDAVEFIDAHTWYTSPGQATAVRQEYLRHAVAEGRGLCTVGEPLWNTQVSSAELAEWACYEAAGNLALTADSPPVSRMCLYDSATLPATVIEEARRTHPDLAGPPRARSRDYVDPRAFTPLPAGRPEPVPAHAASAIFAPGDAAAVQRFVARQGRELGLFGPRVRSLSLAALETVREAVARGPASGRVRVWAESTSVNVEILLQGFVPRRIAGYVPPRPLGTPGRGLWLARQLCDQFTLHPAGPDTVVRLSAMTTRHAPPDRESVAGAA